MKAMVNAWVLGGDGRYPWAVRRLRGDGLPIRCWGVPEMEDQAESLEEALSGANLLLLPMEPFQEEMLAIGGEAVPSALLPYLLGERPVLVGGRFPVETEAWLQQRGVRCVSFLEQEEYLLRNAAVTAEGAVYLLLHYMSRTVAGAKILVLGYGRIGRFLAEKLRNLGAHVTVGARKPSQRTELKLRGYGVVRTGEYPAGLAEFDAIVNTVPGTVISGEQAERIGESCVLLELASKPGGFPAELEKRVVLGRALPGKTAPVTAGENLAEAVWSCLNGEGRTLE